MIRFIAALFCATIKGKTDPDPLIAELQEKLDEISAITGYGFIFGYKDAEHDFGIGSGPRTFAD
jgi:hypothetical protein